MNFINAAGKEHKETFNKLLLGVLIALLFIVGFNALRLSTINNALETSASTTVPGTAAPTVSGGASTILPQGVPAIYGQELGVSFNDVSPNNPRLADKTISALGALDQQIVLTPAQQERYINALYTLNNGLSCEYCCGARAVIFPNGQPACGCAHSYAMRGVAKYLLTRHGDQFTDEQIQEEAAKWKMLFFPGQMELKAKVLASKGIERNNINLASNKYRGIEQGASAGSMVGGC